MKKNLVDFEYTSIILLKANWDSSVRASASSNIIILKFGIFSFSFIFNFANVLIFSLTTLIPLSSEAFN